jgi:hypothetical protein
VGIFPFIDLPHLRYRLRQSAADRKRSFDLEQWAEERGLEIVALQHCGRPPDSVVRQFPPRVSMTRAPDSHYFLIETIDADHVRRSGVARVQHYERAPLVNVHGDPQPLFDSGRVISVVWSVTEQLNWRSRPRRRSAMLPHDRAQGWHADHTGAHELRWYSAGTPTDLVKDGAIESRDPPVGGVL